MDILEKVKDLIADQLDVADKDSITEGSSITDVLHSLRLHSLCRCLTIRTL